MRTLVVILYTVFVPVALGAEHPFAFTFRKDIKGHRIEVVLKLKTFDAKQHNLERKNEIAYIDGAIPVGTDNTFSAVTEFSQFEVRWDGRPVGIPKSYYS